MYGANYYSNHKLNDLLNLSPDWEKSNISINGYLFHDLMLLTDIEEIKLAVLTSPYYWYVLKKHYYKNKPLQKFATEQIQLKEKLEFIGQEMNKISDRIHIKRN